MKAFLFDLNGTMIDDMDYHTNVWHEILNNKLGKNLTKEAVKQEMYGKNSEVLERLFGEDHFSQEEIDKISREKEDAYQDAFKPNLKLLPGLSDFLEAAFQLRIPMAIGSAAIAYNIDFVLDGLDLRKYIPITISAEDVTQSKPHPETFLLAAAELGVEPEQCIVFEDNPKGVEAALNAGMQAVVITTMHEKEDFDGLPNILKFITDYQDPFLQQLLK